MGSDFWIGMISYWTHASVTEITSAATAEDLSL